MTDMSDREHVLTLTLIEARDQIVALRDCILDMEEGGPFYVFGTHQPTEDAWEVWDALMSDAEDRGEGQALCRERIVTQVAWKQGNGSSEAGESRD